MKKKPGFGVTIKNSRDAIKALSMFKDEYLFDFITWSYAIV